MKRALLLACLVLGAASPALGRVGFGDPMEPWREREPGQWLRFDGYLRLRGALYGNLDLDRGPSPTTGKPLWPDGETPLDVTAGSDLRARLKPSVFLGDEVRLVFEVDVLDGVALGQSPRGAPYKGRPAIVAGTTFQDPIGVLDGAFQVRSAYAEVALPFGVLSVGRGPSHFGLGIAANAGDDLDDDVGDRADRVAFVTPLFGHYLGASFDWAAAGPRGIDPASAPAARRISDAQQSVSLSLLRYRAPWEVELYRAAGRLVLDYGVAGSAQWQHKDAPSFYQDLEDALSGGASTRVRRDYLGLVLDVWGRLVYGPLRVEAEAVAAQVHIDNPSPWPGVEMRQPVAGNPFGVVLQAEYLVFEDALSLLAEGGVASADPGYGFPLDEPSAFAGARPGDVTGPQLDVPRDARLDAFRFHPSYRVDLILWRTLLGGVSEAAYGRFAVRARPFAALALELSSIYSHGIYAERTPGGVGPLGVEVDGAATFRYGAFSLRTDLGVLVPLGGLGARGGPAPGVAHMLLVRLGYEA